jgi:hypothetical protein
MSPLRPVLVFLPGFETEGMSTTLIPEQSLSQTEKNVEQEEVAMSRGQRPKFLDEIQKKVLRVSLLAIHSHLYSFALRFPSLQTHATSYGFYSSVTAR